jgi:hypothetical protein
MTSGILAGIERWPLDQLIPYVRNARTHSEDQVAQIAASIIEFGWLNPVLIDDAVTSLPAMSDCLLHASLGSISGAKDAPKYRIHFAAHSSAQRLTMHLIIADCRRLAPMLAFAIQETERHG